MFGNQAMIERAVSDALQKQIIPLQQKILDEKNRIFGENLDGWEKEIRATIKQIIKEEMEKARK